MFGLLQLLPQLRGIDMPRPELPIHSAILHRDVVGVVVHTMRDSGVPTAMYGGTDRD